MVNIKKKKPLKRFICVLNIKSKRKVIITVLFLTLTLRQHMFSSSTYQPYIINQHAIVYIYIFEIVL